MVLPSGETSVIRSVLTVNKPLYMHPQRTWLHLSDTLPLVRLCRVARDAHCWRSVDRNSFRSPRGEHVSRSVQPRPPGSTFVRTAISRYAPLAVRLMEIENTIRYTPRAVGLKPPAIQGEARLRGLYWNLILLKDHKLPAIQGEARLRGLERIITQRP